MRQYDAGPMGGLCLWICQEMCLCYPLGDGDGVALWRLLFLQAGDVFIRISAVVVLRQVFVNYSYYDPIVLKSAVLLIVSTDFMLGIMLGGGDGLQLSHAPTSSFSFKTLLNKKKRMEEGR